MPRMYIDDGLSVERYIAGRNDQTALTWGGLQTEFCPTNPNGEKKRRVETGVAIKSSYDSASIRRVGS